MKINTEILKEIDENEKVCILSKVLPDEIKILIIARATGMVDMAEMLSQKYKNHP